MLAGVLVIALSLAAAVLAGPGPWPWAAEAPDAEQSSGRLTDWPTPGGDAAGAPLGTPPPAPPGGGPHAFVELQTDGSTPVAYDPCRPVHYVLRTDGAPAGTEELVHSAVERLARATGLRLVYDGPTSEPLVEDRPPFQPDRYGDRWAPVLIGWRSDVTESTLDGDVIGEGGSTSISIGSGPRVFVTGSVTLDAPDLTAMMAEPDGPALVEAVVLHELGHVVGLDHVDDPAQLMYPETVPDVVDFAAGDLEGLSRLGRGACVPQV